MYKSMAVLGICIGLVTGASAMMDATTYQIDRAFSSAEIQHAFRGVTGRFADYQGSFVYEPRHVEQSSIAWRLPIESLMVNNGWQSPLLKGSELFDVEAYPDIIFVSTRVQNYGSMLKVTGQLSMLGVTREVTFPVAVLGRGTHPESGLPIAGFKTEFTIRLSDFNMNEKTNAAVILGDQIKFKLKMVGVGVPS